MRLQWSAEDKRPARSRDSYVVARPRRRLIFRANLLLERAKADVRKASRDEFFFAAPVADLPGDGGWR
jgi:hypothetical protein